MAELWLGYTDTLAALVANIIDADVMVILTDQEGLFDADPRNNTSAKLVASASATDASLSAMAGNGSSLGRGGMVTKITAAMLASRSGTSTLLANGREPRILSRSLPVEEIGTLLTATS